VEEQSASTGEVGRSMAQAAGGAQDIAQGIAAVVTTADRTTQRAQQVNAAAARLSAVADGLGALVEGARATASQRHRPSSPALPGGPHARWAEPAVARDEEPVPVA
jgi:methyl-accepting chemotaxis protein